MTAGGGAFGGEGAPPIAIARVEGDLADIEAVDAIARASFPGEELSAATEISRPWARVYLARGLEPGAAPLGFLVIWHVADELHVLNVATTPEARRRGIGRALMDVAMAYAVEHGVRLVLLEVRRSNEAARRLYRRLGFDETSVRRGYYADNGEDAIEMMRTIEG